MEKKVTRRVALNHIHVIDMVPDETGVVNQVDKGNVDIEGEFRSKSSIKRAVENLGKFENPIVASCETEYTVYSMPISKFMENATEEPKSTTPAQEK